VVGIPKWVSQKEQRKKRRGRRKNSPMTKARE